MRRKVAKTEQHIHRFKKIKYKSGNQVFFCALPDCNKKLSVQLALGKRSICWRCSEPFIMSEYSLRLSKPHCEACHKSKKEVDISFLPQPLEMSLSDRLSQTIQQALPEEDEL